jgi:hypothetical protein
VSLVDGIYTVGEVEKETASDECNRMSVGDDVLAVDDQTIVSLIDQVIATDPIEEEVISLISKIGWSPLNIDKLLESKFEHNSSFTLLMRKMPRANAPTLKQQLAMNSISTIPREKRKSHRDRKHSFADVFLS